jgi:uncharacterized BrkB/YihY/UPF0761 family membrane protein
MIESAIACAFCANNKSSFINGYLRTIGFIIAIILILTAVASFLETSIKIAGKEYKKSFSMPVNAGLLGGGLLLIFLSTVVFSRKNIEKRRAEPFDSVAPANPDRL